MDANVSLMDLVVQQYHVLHIETSGQSDAGEARQTHQLIRLGHCQRIRVASCRVPVEQSVLLDRTPRLPVTQRHQAHENEAGKHKRGNAPSHGIAADVYCEFAVPGIHTVPKIFVVLMLVVIICSLAAGFVFLINDRGTTTRTVRALTWRIGLSIVLVLLLMAGFATGLIRPHGALPVAPTAVEPQSE